MKWLSQRWFFLLRPIPLSGVRTAALCTLHIKRVGDKKHYLNFLFKIEKNSLVLCLLLYIGVFSLCFALHSFLFLSVGFLPFPLFRTFNVSFLFFLSLFVPFPQEVINITLLLFVGIIEEMRGFLN